MTLLALLRHGTTSWNTEGRTQGRADIGLSAAGIAELRALSVPARLSGAAWIASPLGRAQQTAALLHGPARPEPRLIETDWGAWEGLPVTAYRPFAAHMTGRGRGGLDLRPPGGESPRDVQARLRDLFAELATATAPVVGVTHKGVIRAALSLATGWDMADKAPVKLAWRALHLFDIAADGSLSLREANVALESRS
ncbi:MAG: histidine phosphatase family protein [Alphaproteobacteria bacterium]|nr:histidine phosphatase family protein [Alphaproteobacteria bacterium]